MLEVGEWMVLLFAISKKYDKVLYTPHNWLSPSLNNCHLHEISLFFLLSTYVEIILMRWLHDLIVTKLCQTPGDWPYRELYSRNKFYIGKDARCFGVLPCLLTLSGPGGGGGGSEARMAKLTAANQKPLILWCPNLVTFSFYPWDTFWPHFSKIGQSGGLLLLFSHRDIPKILKMKNFSYAWKLLKFTWGVNFGSRRTILDIKTHFFQVKPVFRG